MSTSLAKERLKLREGSQEVEFRTLRTRSALIAAFPAVLSVAAGVLPYAG